MSEPLSERATLYAPGLSIADVALLLAARWHWIASAAVVAGLLAFGATFLVAPVYTARTSFLPPQQQQNAAAAALSSLSGALSGLAGGAALRTPADQYVGLLQSTSVADRVIEEFKLMEVYDAQLRVDARRELERNVRIAVGRKDGLMTVEVDDVVPTRAAAIANRYVDELRRVTSKLALTEAQQRRVFFEAQLQQTREKLTVAQATLQSSGFDAASLRAEPRAAAEAYARVKAEVTAAEVALVALQRNMADGAPEVTRQTAVVQALRAQLGRLETVDSRERGAEYVSKFRDFKYQETLFDLFSRQYELARLDESREGALIQVVDVADVPERKSRPRRGPVALAAALVASLLTAAWIVTRRFLGRHADT